MGSLDGFLNEIFDESNQNLSSLEEAEHLMRQVQRGELSPRVAAAQMTRNQVKSVGTFRSPAAAATFDLVITRNSANIARSLPVPIFGALDRESQYVEVFGLIDSAIAVTCATGTDKKSLRFTYVEGANTDTIDVSCNQYPYVSLLQATQTCNLTMEQNKMIISDSAIQNQFTRTIHLLNRSMFGAAKTDKLTPNQYKTDLQNQNDMRTIDAIINVDSEKYFAPMINNTAAFTVTFTSFISFYNKVANRI